MLRWGHTELRVRDMEAARAFYCDILGLEVSAEQGPFLWLKCGAHEILLRPLNADGPQSSFEQSSNIVWYCQDLAATKAKLEARGLRFQGQDQGCPTFQDPDGHWFQLVNPEGH